MASKATSVPQSHDDVISVDDDSNSDYGSDVFSDTTSLTSSVLDYKYVNGRRYQAYKEDAYWGPNDEQQNNQLDLFHHVYALVLDGNLYRAPIENPQRILDLGTGTGIWAIDMADKYPAAEIRGNGKFEVDDFTLPWTFRENYFSFIHARALYGSLTLEGWPETMSKAYRHLAPGGWLECVEMTSYVYSDDGSHTDSSAISVYSKLLNESSEAMGKPFDIAHRLEGWATSAGFANVKEEIYKVPTGPWPREKKFKEIGAWNNHNITLAIEGYAMALFTNVLRKDPDETRTLLQKVKEELNNKKIHAYGLLYVVYGQKPE